MRCFVAVDLPDDVRAAVAAVQTDARAAAPRADVAWVDPAKLHLTLKFLGGRGRRGDRRARRARAVARKT
jgi:2'-5' RNA ligase